MIVGWIGLGMMGLGMAKCATRAGFAVVGHTRGRPEHVGLIEAGGRLSDDLADIVAADVLCVAVFTDDQVREILYGDGVLARLRPRAVLVIHTTGDPALSQRIAADAPAGVMVVDGAFSGTPQQASEGSLTIMAGGTVEAFERVRPLLESYAALVRHVGPLGSGMQLKLINNLLFSAQVRLVAATYRIAATQGFDAVTVGEILGRCSAASRALEIIGAQGTVAANLDRMRFYVEKDIAVAQSIAVAQGLDLGIVGEVAAGLAGETV
jgi:3-hydroxyisobutyrate dehydrogenase